MPNRLAHESSPYLLQHAGNPVDWYPWGQEAFDLARATDRPIFLSVGYSTCHWCHVMEHESFDDPAIADVLNARFVPIKVDREERPDVDRVYMTFVQATTGSGGWPMSVWLTPDLKPIVGGTYFPPTSRWGRPGFLEILQQISGLWHTDRQRLVSSADAVTERLREAVSPPGGDAAAGPAADVAGREALAAGVDAFRGAYDPHWAGFGSAPKFPRPSELLFLLREHARTGDRDAREMVLATLDAMARGGMRDHLGGGFHRYSVDARWRVPHFEKMLYDQAQLVLAYLEAASASGERFYAEVAADTLDYVSRELADEAGSFYSAEDADSVPPEEAGDPSARKMEGACYLWTEAEIDALFEAGEAAAVRARYGIEPAGNAPEDPHGELANKNVLYLAMSIEDVAARERRPPEAVAALLARARARLFAERTTRPRPHLDDKVLTAWNGLMIAAFARAARAPAPADDPGRPARDAAVAERAVRFILDGLWDERRQILHRRYRRGQVAIDGYCEDYAYLVWAMLELFQTTGAAEWLDWARRLQARQDALFWDPVHAGWFGTTGDDPSVLLRLKEDYDGAEPAASSVAVMNLMTLAHLTGEVGAWEKAERTLARGGDLIGRAARAVPFMMANLSAYHAGLRQVVIVGPRGRDDTRALAVVLASNYQPFTIVVPVDPDEQPRLAGPLPFIAPMTMREGRATAYVCRNFACDEPTTDPARLRQLLGVEAG